MGPLFPGPEGPMMGPRMRGPMPPRMQGGHGVVRGMVPGPRPLLPEMVSFSLFFALSSNSHIEKLLIYFSRFLLRLFFLTYLNFYFEKMLFDATCIF